MNYIIFKTINQLRIKLLIYSFASFLADLKKISKRYFNLYIEDVKARELKADKFFADLKNINAPVSEFDEKAFKRLVERMVVRDDGI